MKDFQRESKSETLRETLSRFYIGLGYLVKLNLMVHVKVFLTFSLLFHPWVKPKRCECTKGLTFKVKVTEISKLFNGGLFLAIAFSSVPSQWIYLYNCIPSLPSV